MHPQDLTDRLATVVAIPITPFDGEGEVDWPLLATLTRRLVDHGITALTVNGNTGEFYALSPAERRRAVEVTVEAAGDRATVVAGVGFDLRTAREDARHARDAGANAVMVHEPAHPYLSPTGWAGYNAAVASAVPEIGVLPYVRSPRITGEAIRSLAEGAPNLVGLKYSVPDPAHFAGTLADVGRDDLLWIAGLAEPYAPAYWQAGARAFTSGLVNVSPAVSLAMLAGLRAGDAASVAAQWRRIRRFEELRSRDGSADNVSVVKEAMAQAGLCRRDVRPPSRQLPEDVAAAVTSAVADWPGLTSGDAA
ncbi:dihydrodipicolinate synthase family protein [Actinoalloteichus caeruleus]|uniref:4-hydroxy-tetrahydrodipicolinate synthase n=1 Tax=Actinoalloteichus caeruleus DSM 43889 TaxID=1120930 RepID=A0ABT1JCH9_ACTCY|nr:dihydrodipicolinate synthase family protein [Actinoalloteichus caeruleus]MCP2330195.1 4-hydroxy-tetrahydrodipicolinate synthase [Actinoalloteichus caeruleus DSM 43889]